MAQNIVLRNLQSPGDLLMMTAAVRDLHRCYPGRFVTDVDTSNGDIWLNNPYITRLPGKTTRTQKLGYPLIHRSNQCGLHFLQGFIQHLNTKLGLKIRLTEFRADVHWSDEELRRPLVDGDYWVIISGGKADITAKWWDPLRYQAVVDKLGDQIKFVQLGNKPDGGGARHFHPPLRGTLNLVGQTTLREAMRVVHHARGVVTPVTCFMHMAAASGVPAVVIAGGREHYTWEAYTNETFHRNMAYAAGLVKQPPGSRDQWYNWSPNDDPDYVPHPFAPHAYLHTIGMLSCCKEGGCWRAHVDHKLGGRVCQNVVRVPGHPPLPKCLDMITVDDVVRAVKKIEEERLNTRDEKKVHPTKEESIISMSSPPDELSTIANKDNETTGAAQPSATAEPGKSQADHLPPELQFEHLTFPITFCVLTYGDYPHIIERCLKSIYEHTDQSLFELRLGMNAVSERSKRVIFDFLNSYAHNVTAIYEADPQIYKCPMMHKMFHDPAHPLADWIMWFDDDTRVTNHDWIKVLGQNIDKQFTKQDTLYPKGYHMFGKVYFFHYRGNQINATSRNGRGWIEQASWYAGRPYRLDHRDGKALPKSDFCTGGWWIITRQALEAIDWPDLRMKQRGDDVIMGEALYQQGYGIAQVNDANGIWFKMLELDGRSRGYQEPMAGIA